jgi:hypothetical protein
MEDFKKDLFLKEYKNHINCQPVTIIDKKKLISYLESYGEHRFKNNSFFKALIENLPNKMVLDSVDSTSEFANVLRTLDIQGEQNVIVIWDYPNDMDKFNINYLLKYWEDIWFSVSDEMIGLFFPAINKMIVITHYNNIYY